jgi:hypothetical protein
MAREVLRLLAQREQLREALGKAALTFSDLRVALELLRHPTLAEACAIADEHTRAALVSQQQEQQ